MARPQTGDDENDAAVVIGIIVVVFIVLIVAGLVVGGPEGFVRDRLSHDTPISTPTITN